MPTDPESKALAAALFASTHYGYAVEIARALDVSPNIVRQWRQHGRIPPWHQEAVREYLRNREKSIDTRPTPG